MRIIQNTKFPSIYLRFAIGSAYLWEVADRLGLLGAHGQPHVGWGNWAHFVTYARQVMSFLPSGPGALSGCACHNWRGAVWSAGFYRSVYPVCRGWQCDIELLLCSCHDHFVWDRLTFGLFGFYSKRLELFAGNAAQILLEHLYASLKK